jgi:hypothetical protein
LVEGSIWRRKLNWVVRGCWCGGGGREDMAGGGDGVMGRDVGECRSRMLPPRGLVGTRSSEVEERKKNIRKIIWIDNG